jgi:DNA-binding SARP family transcriptional activator/tetratricopeptide (TPR) repeat protein
VGTLNAFAGSPPGDEVVGVSRTAEDSLRIQVLGAVRAFRDGRELDVGTPRQRAVLAVLAINSHRAVSRDELVDAVWGFNLPSSAVQGVYTYIAGLRRVLEPGRVRRGTPAVLVDGRPGYQLSLRPGQLDMQVFRERLEQARRLTAAGDAAALAAFDAALDLWKGAPLSGVPGPFAEAEQVRLNELRLAAVEDRAAAILDLGGEGDVLAELAALVRQHPLRERLRTMLMRALHQRGRRAEALEVFADARRVLVDELGVEPGTELQHLYRDLLVAEPEPTPPSGTRPAAAGRSRWVVPAQLPRGIPTFVGRTAELARIEELTRTEELTTGGDGGASVAGSASAAILVIDGMAGVGKTALAVHYGHEVARRYPDGQLFADLRGVDPRQAAVTAGEALGRFLRAFDVEPDRIPVDLDERTALYRSMLAGRRVLVVLDNAGSADQVRPLLPVEPTCLAVVTSRHRLAGLVARDGALPLTLETLPPGDGIHLLERVVGRSRLRVEERDAAELARLCGYLPLALRIVAAHIAVRPHLAVAEAAKELADSGLGAFAVAGDQTTTVRAVFDHSYRALDGEARRLFRLCGGMPGVDFTVEAAAALAGTRTDDTRSPLARLVTAHLVEERTPGRYQTHDLLRRYAVERAGVEADAGEQQQAVRRLFDWYLDAAEAAAGVLYPDVVLLPHAARPALVRFADFGAALTWLEAERANLMAAVRYAVSHGPHSHAWLLTDALRGFFLLRRYVDEWLAAAQAGLAAATQGQDRRAQAAMHLSLANAHRGIGRLTEAVTHYTAALAINRRIGWHDGEAAGLGGLGLTYQDLGRLARATACHRRALAISQQTGALRRVAVELNNLGFSCLARGQLHDALEHLTQALELTRRLGLSAGEAAAADSVGATYHLLGRFDLAVEHLTGAVAVSRQVGSRGSETSALIGLGAVHRDARRYDTATGCAREALELAQDMRNPRLEADATNTLASILGQLGQLDEALAGHQRALRGAGANDYLRGQAEALCGLAATQQSLGRTDEALGRGHDALVLVRRSGHRLVEARALTILGAAFLDAARPDDAIEASKRAASICRRAGYRLGHARALIVLSHATRAREGAMAAAASWRQALAILGELGVPEPAALRPLPG